MKKLPALVVALLVLSATASASPAPSWVAAWGGSPTGSATGGPANATVRDLVRVSVGGTQVRIRVANVLSTDTPLVIGRASIALAKAPGSAELAGPSHPITFSGNPGVTLAPNTPYVYSDPIDLPVADQQDLAIDLYLPAATEPGATAATANTSYASADGSGDKVGQASGDGFSAGASSNALPGQCTGCATYALTAVDVYGTEATGSIIGLGSSTFAGDGSDQDKWDTVLNDLSRRIDTELGAGQRVGIVNAGISGDTLNAGLVRAQRDVYSQSGVIGEILYDINDIAPPLNHTAEQVEADYRKAVVEAHARGIRAFCPTWPPDASTITLTDERSKINAWLLSSGTCDDIVDWGQVLRQPGVDQSFRPEYFADGIHPNPKGQQAMADATPLRWFTAGPFGTVVAAPKACVSRRSLVLHPKASRGQVLHSATVFLNGKKIAARKGRHVAVKVNLAGLKRGVARVTLFLRYRSGRSSVQTRVYATCVPASA